MFFDWSRILPGAGTGPPRRDQDGPRRRNGCLRDRYFAPTLPPCKRANTLGRQKAGWCCTATTSLAGPDVSRQAGPEDGTRHGTARAAGSNRISMHKWLQAQYLRPSYAIDKIVNCARQRAVFQPALSRRPRHSDRWPPAHSWQPAWRAWPRRRTCKSGWARWSRVFHHAAAGGHCRQRPAARRLNPAH